jgi:hypothetical protein
VDATVPGAVDRLRAGLAAAPGGAESAGDWGEWTAKLGAGRTLLVLLVHTDRVAADDPAPRMEIGRGSWLEVAYLEREHVRPAADAPPPVVLLLGCETGAPEVSFHGLVSRLRRKGAAIVLATHAAIHSAHAVPVAEELIRALRELAAGRRRSFGEVMRIARCRALAAGLPMALCLEAHGDADWVFAAA